MPYKTKWFDDDLCYWINDGCSKDVGVNVTEFYCYSFYITKLPNEIGQLINLQILNCCNNKITELPKEIGYLIIMSIVVRKILVKIF